MLPGFCKSATTAEIAPMPRAHARAYVGAEEVEDEREGPFE